MLRSVVQVLWFATNTFDDFVVWDRLHGNGTLHQPIKQFAATCRTPPVEPESKLIQIAILTSPAIASLLRKTRKTLRLWERQGHGPRGLPWPKGRHVAGNLVVYDLEESWPALSAYLDKHFKQDRRWMDALAQASLPYSHCHNPVLDDIIANEKIKARKSAPAAISQGEVKKKIKIEKSRSKIRPPNE